MNKKPGIIRQLRKAIPEAIRKGTRLFSKLVEVVGVCPKCGNKLTSFKLDGEVGHYDYQCGAKLEIKGGPLSDDRQWAKRCPFELSGVDDFDSSEVEQ